jgi:hypothetical protein
VIQLLSLQVDQQNSLLRLRLASHRATPLLNLVANPLHSHLGSQVVLQLLNRVQGPQCNLQIPLRLNRAVPRLANLLLLHHVNPPVDPVLSPLLVLLSSHLAAQPLSRLQNLQCSPQRAQVLSQRVHLRCNRPRNLVFHPPINLHLGLHVSLQPNPHVCLRRNHQ